MSNTNAFRNTHIQRQPQRQVLPQPQQQQQQLLQQPRNYQNQLSPPPHTRSPVEYPAVSSSVPVNFVGFSHHHHHRHRHQHYGGQESVHNGNQSMQRFTCEEQQQQRNIIDYKVEPDLDADADDGDVDHGSAATATGTGTGSAGSSTATPAWDIRFRELMQWKKMHDNTCVPKGEGPLGRWVARQRELKRTNKLIKTREDKLNDIGFVWNTVTAMWDERFRRLCLWRAQHGHCAVPIAQGDLGIWVSKQRQLKKKRKLSQDKIDRLNSLAFTWSTTDADWDDKFKRLTAWRRRNGHCSVPFNEGELGWWVNTQRQCKRKGKLSGSRQKELDSIGFVWNPSLCSQLQQQQQQERQSHQLQINRETQTWVKEEQEIVSSSDGGNALGKDCNVATEEFRGSGMVGDVDGNDDGEKMMTMMMMTEGGTTKSGTVVGSVKREKSDDSGEKYRKGANEEDEEVEEEDDSDNSDDSDDNEDDSDDDSDDDDSDDDDSDDDGDDDSSDDIDEEEKDENVGDKAAVERRKEERNGDCNCSGNGDDQNSANSKEKLKGNGSVQAHGRNDNKTENQQQNHNTMKPQQTLNNCKQVESKMNVPAPQADDLNSVVQYQQKHDVQHRYHQHRQGDDHGRVNNHTTDDTVNNDDNDAVFVHDMNWGLSLEQQFLPWQVSSRAAAGASASSMPVLLGRDDIDSNASWMYMSQHANGCSGTDNDNICSSSSERDVRDDVQVWGSSSSVSDMWSALHASVVPSGSGDRVVRNGNANENDGGNGTRNGGCNGEMEDVGCVDDNDRYAAEEMWIAEMMEVVRREGPF